MEHLDNIKKQLAKGQTTPVEGVSRIIEFYKTEAMVLWNKHDGLIANEKIRLYEITDLINDDMMTIFNKLVNYVEGKCIKCGAEKANYFVVNENGYTGNMCFDCHFWMEKIHYVNNDDKMDNGEQVIRCNGVHYSIKLEDANGFRGFNGAKFRFKLLKDNSIIESSNVWHQGDIPEEFKKELPDNAIRI